MSDEKLTLKREGNEVIFKRQIEPEKLKSSDILNIIHQLEGSIVKYEDQMSKLKSQIEQIPSLIEETNKRLKDVKKYEEWAISVQESLARTLFAEVKEECQKNIEDSYKYDNFLTEEQNTLQKYHQYRQAVATHEKIGPVIHPSINKKMFFTECIVENPWKLSE